MRVLSGIQPSGSLHIGNYLGALKQFRQLQDQGEECFFSIVDLHAITTLKDKNLLEQFVKESKRVFCAVGLKAPNSVLFVQSAAPSHAELAWILSSITPMGDLERMTQFKDKKSQGVEINAGLFTYPVLMAADILLYKTDAVPVGQDQEQHLELTRSLARRFNSYFGETLKEPKSIINNSAPLVMSLKSPEKKMSKSLGEAHYVGMFESEEQIKEKFKRATTDSDNEIIYDPQKKPGVSNLIAIYAAFENKTPLEAQSFFDNSSYAALKEEVAKKVIEKLSPIQKRFETLKDEEIEKEFNEGARRAKEASKETIKEVYRKVGLL